MDKIKVLQAIRQGRFGGGETHVYDLSLNLNKNLFEPIVLSFTDGDMVRKLIDQNVQVHIINSKYPFDFRTLRKV
ncbi:MAG: glycosyltransferase family 1 protein, partial [Bacteroidota bacterium]